MVLLMPVSGPGGYPFWRDIADQLRPYPYVASACALILLLTTGLAWYRLRHGAARPWRRKAVVIPAILALATTLFAMWAWLVYAPYLSPAGMSGYDGRTYDGMLFSFGLLTILAVMAALATSIAVGFYLAGKPD